MNYKTIMLKKRSQAKLVYNDINLNNELFLKRGDGLKLCIDVVLCGGNNLCVVLGGDCTVQIKNSH